MRTCLPLFENKRGSRFPGGSNGKEWACNAGGLAQEDLLEKGLATHSSAPEIPGEFHGQRSPVGCSSWGCKELDMTE